MGHSRPHCACLGSCRESSTQTLAPSCARGYSRMPLPQEWGSWQGAWLWGYGRNSLTQAGPLRPWSQ